jgi:hypothetical protein
VVVADIEAIETAANGRDDVGISVPEVEDSAVAVAVPVPATAEGVLEPRTAPFADDDVDPERLECASLAPVDVRGEGGRGLGAGGVGLGRSPAYRIGMLVDTKILSGVLRENLAPRAGSRSSRPGCARYFRSNRSRFITLVQAATKSLTNFSVASSLA